MHRAVAKVVNFNGRWTPSEDRCNLIASRDGWKQDADIPKRAAESFSNLLEYAKQAKMNVVIENHGGASSDSGVLTSIMKLVNDPDFGTLPDFGNVNEVEPNDTPAQATKAPAGLPIAFNGVIDKPDDVDYFRFTAKKDKCGSRKSSCCSLTAFFALNPVAC